MATRKAQQQAQEAKADEAATDATANEPQTADDTAAGADAAATAPPDASAGEPAEAVTVLILRDETVAGVDYRPGDTPEVPGNIARALVDRRVADDNPEAIAIARHSQHVTDDADEVIE